MAIETLIYATWEEKRFIDELGSHCERTARTGMRGPVMDRKELLKRYAKAAKTRSWGDLNGPEVIAHLNCALVDAGVDPKTI